jgi:hypothetical protein
MRRVRAPGLQNKVRRFFHVRFEFFRGRANDIVASSKFNIRPG